MISQLALYNQYRLLAPPRPRPRPANPAPTQAPQDQKDDAKPEIKISGDNYSAKHMLRKPGNHK